MWLKRLIIIILLLICLIITTQSLAFEFWSDDFDVPSNQPNWIEVANYQLLQPEYPCRGPDTDAYHFQQSDQRMELNIVQSAPCWLAIVPSNFETPINSNFALSFSTTIYSPSQDRNWLVWWQDQDNYWQFHTFQNTIYPEKIINGVVQNITPNYVFYNFSSSSQYDVQINYFVLQNKLELYINGQFIANFSDTGESFDFGSPGLAGSVGAGVRTSQTWYDDFEIVKLPHDSNRMNLPPLKQNDPAWSAQEYDRASTWSSKQISIGRFGCALTSANIVLSYYGFSSFQNGEHINPASLNNWLNSQPDGYLTHGLLNWRAISRLTSQLSSTENNLPILEFGYFDPGNKSDWLKSQLSKHYPVILALPDHFVVASGINPDSETVFITDPFYDRTELSSSDYVSARLFQPSHTNLQAVTLVLPAGTWVELESQQITPQLEIAPDGSSWWIYDWPKIQTDLDLQIWSTNVHHQFGQILIYDQQGNLTNLENIKISSTKHSIQINQMAETPQIIISPSSPVLNNNFKNMELSPFVVQKMSDWTELLSQSNNLAESEQLLANIDSNLNDWKHNNWLTQQLGQDYLDQINMWLNFAFP